MATNVYLMKYELDDNLHYLEDSSEIIHQCSISISLMEKIRKNIGIGELQIFEEKNSNISSKTEVIMLEDSKKLLTFSEDYFVKLFAKKNEDRQDSIFEFREITNLYYLTYLKIEKYLDDKSVVITIG